MLITIRGTTVDMNMYDAEVAEKYAANRKIHPGVLRNILEDGQVQSGSAVLEVGCGTGNYISALQEISGCQGWGIDPSTDMLSRAAARETVVTFGDGRAEALPFASASFDLVYSVDVIHHVKDRAAAYREAFRVLRPGGQVCTVTDSEEIIRNRAPLARYFPETVAVELGRYPSMAELQALMRTAGFIDASEILVEIRADLTDIQAYRDKAFSSLLLISPEAFDRGITRMEADLQRGPLEYISRYVLEWGRKPEE